GHGLCRAEGGPHPQHHRVPGSSACERIIASDAVARSSAVAAAWLCGRQNSATRLHAFEIDMPGLGRGQNGVDGKNRIQHREQAYVDIGLMDPVSLEK